MADVHKVTRKYGGSVAARAAKAGKSVKAFVAGNIHADSDEGKLARLAYIAQGVHGSGRSSMGDSGDKRTPRTKLYQVG